MSNEVSSFSKSLSLYLWFSFIVPNLSELPRDGE